MKEIILPAGTENLQKAGTWMIGNIQFNVPLSSVCALNEMDNAASVIRDRKDIYRHSLKRHLNIALSHADTKKVMLLSYNIDRKAFDEYTDHIADVTEDDVRQLRTALEQELMERGMVDAGLVAWVESANLLLHLAVRHYQTVIAQGNRQANRDLEERKRRAVAMYADRPQYLRSVLRQQEIDYDIFFRHVCLANVTDAWNNVATQLNPELTVLTEGNVLDKVQAISRKYSDGTYINKCIDLMRHHPMFADMQATPAEDSSID